MKYRVLIVICGFILSACMAGHPISARISTMEVKFSAGEQDIKMWTMRQCAHTVCMAAWSLTDSLIHVLYEQDSAYVETMAFVPDTLTLMNICKGVPIHYESDMLMLNDTLLCVVAACSVYSVYDVRTGELVFQRCNADSSVGMSHYSMSGYSLSYDEVNEVLVYIPFIWQGVSSGKYAKIAVESVFTGAKQLVPVYAPQVKENESGYPPLAFTEALLCVADGKYVAAYQNNNTIFSYNPAEARTDSFNVAAEHYTAYPRSYRRTKINNMSEQMEFMMHSALYDYYNNAFIYDKYNRVYYRTFSMAQPELNKQGYKNTLNDKRTGVSIISNNMEYIGDYVQNNLMFGPRKYVPLPQGLCTLNSTQCHKSMCSLKKGYYEVVQITFAY